MKKKLEWTFEKLEVPEQAISAFASCTSFLCYFTRPLYDESAEGKKELESKTTKNDITVEKLK